MPADVQRSATRDGHGRFTASTRVSPKKRRLEAAPANAQEAQIFKETQLCKDALKPFVKDSLMENKEVARAKLRRHFGVQVVLVIGKEKDTIILPAATVHNSSDFFRKAMDETKWAVRNEETGFITVQLPESDFFHVGYFMAWVQGNKIGGPQIPLPTTGIETAQLLIELYKYGEEVMSEPFKNAVMDATRAAFDQPGLAMCVMALEEAFTGGLPENCSLQRFFIDFTIERMPSRNMGEFMLIHAPRLFLKVVQGMKDDRMNGVAHRGVFLNRASCVYHDHKLTPPCRYP
ncbi:hypothetical protein BDZ85DRAFT_281683 [Elsinoe ampelina]|uniref:BTB domain-containing protein n=1 Tax=Elsinoe ampelina TaxID=302913 RepID=A0A6A6GDG6_9PEZI|nr:hypothetical protein BDZ85DRAFT_281683 [Elsinoe ampelina]